MNAQGDPIRMDGDLIAEAVADEMPDWMTDTYARHLAERVLLRLSATPGVVVTRGPDDAPWPPMREPAKPAEPVTAPPVEPWTTDDLPVNRGGGVPFNPPPPMRWDVA